MIAANPRLTEADIREVLCATADRIELEDAAYDATGWSSRYGCGRVDAAAAVVAVADLGPPGAPAFLEPEHEANVRPGELVLSWTEAEDPDGDLLFYSVELRPFGVEDDSEDEDVARGLGDDDDSAADDDDADGDDDDSAGAEPVEDGVILVEGLTETSIDLSEQVEDNTWYRATVWASDGWGPGERSAELVFGIIPAPIDTDPQGSGCTCSSASQAGRGGLLALLVGVLGSGLVRRRCRTWRWTGALPT